MSCENGRRCVALYLFGEPFQLESLFVSKRITRPGLIRGAYLYDDSDLLFIALNSAKCNESAIALK